MEAQAGHSQINVFGHKISLYLKDFYHFDFSIKDKKLKSEEWLGPPQPVNISAVEAIDIELAMEEFRKKASGQIPSVADIAPLAAILAIGKPMDIRSLSEAAFNLWQACKEEREKRIDGIARRAFGRAKEAKKNDRIPTPQKLPIDFGEFLKLLIGGKYKNRRIKIYRDYAKDMIWLSHINSLVHPRNPANKISFEEAEKIAKPASLDELADWMKSVDRRIESEEQYRLSARAFLEWYDKQRSERAKNAAAKRWGKQKPEA